MYPAEYCDGGELEGLGDLCWDMIISRACNVFHICIPQTLQTLLRRELFTDVLVPRHPPVFHEWFLKNFPDPAKWYRARQAYVRTAAVMSMVGYVTCISNTHAPLATNNSSMFHTF